MPDARRVAVLLGALALAGCGSGESPSDAPVPAPTTSSDRLSVETVTDEYGDRYLCVVYHSYVGVALSCDWTVAR